MKEILSVRLIPVSVCFALFACGPVTSQNSDSSVNNSDGSLAVNTTPALIKLQAIDQAGMTVRVSVDSGGNQADQNSISSSISENGQIVVFESIATNLVANDLNGQWDIFARNRRDNTTHRLSVANDGTDADGGSLSPHISADGRFVTFASSATNLVTADTNGLQDIFVRDLVTNETARVSVNNEGQESNGASDSPRISRDGRYIVYVSTATNLSADDSDIGRDIFRYDRDTGQTRLLSTDINGVSGNGDSASPDVSADGQRIVFSSAATNLVEADTNNATDIFVKSLSDGSILRVSVDSAGTQSNAASELPTISSDGNVIAFRSIAANLTTTDSNNFRQTYAHDMATGETIVVSRNALGEAGNSGSLGRTGISGDGRFITFYSDASNLIDGDNNNSWDVFVHDRLSQSMQVVSQSSDGTMGNGRSFEVSISDNGNYLSFGSNASNLVADDTNNTWDIFVHVLTPHNFPPVAKIDINSVIGDSPFTIQVDASGSTDPEGDALTYHWDFGDLVNGNPVGATGPDNVSDAVADTHTYELPGNYTVLLTVTDSVGNQDQAFVTVQVNAPNMPPSVLPTADNYTGTAPLTVQFQANAQDPENNALTYHWEFGDGGISDAANPVYIFENSGTFVVIVTVSDGEFDVSAQLTISVSSPFTMVTQKALVEYEHGGRVNGKIAFRTQVDMPDYIDADDIVSLKLDDLLVFEATFGEISNQNAGRHSTHESDHHSYYSSVYSSKHQGSEIEFSGKRKHLHIEFAVKDGILNVQQEKRYIGNKIDNRNGVDVILSIGQNVAVEHIVMKRVGEAAHCYDDGGPYHEDQSYDTAQRCHSDQKKLKLIYQLNRNSEGDSSGHDDD